MLRLMPPAILMCLAFVASMQVAPRKAVSADGAIPSHAERQLLAPLTERQVREQFERFNPATPRKAIQDLVSVYADNYPQGSELLKEHDAIKQEAPDVRIRLQEGDAKGIA